MTKFRYEYQSDFAREHYGRGFAVGLEEGRAIAAGCIGRGLLKFLQRRGLEATEEQCARIEACTDLAVVERWLERSFEAKSIDDLFG